MESKSTFFILIVIIAVLALSLAVLAGYMFIIQGSSNDEDKTVAAEATKEIPKKEDRITIALFEQNGQFNLKSADGKLSVIQVKVTLDCHKQLKENKKTDVTAVVTAYKDEIQELVIRFFLNKTIDEVRDVEAMDKAKSELIDQINALLNEGVKKPEDVVYKVIFSEWLFA